jgi:hypothetical protein
MPGTRKLATLAASVFGLGALVLVGCVLDAGAQPAQAATNVSCYRTVLVQRVINGYPYWTYFPAASNTTCILGNGNQGSAVKAVQEAMNLSANGSQGLKVDGIWGTKTTSAMANVQSRVGARPVDGVYGPVTRDKMYWLWRYGLVA